MTRAILLKQLPLIAIVFLIGEFGEVLWRTEGHYHARRLSYTLCFIMLFLLATLKKKYLNPNFIFKLKTLKQTFFLVLAYWNFKMFLDPKVIYIQVIWINYLIKYSSLLICLLFIRYTFFPEKFEERKIWPLFLLILLFRILTILGSPTPIIDVFTSNTEAVKGLLQFVNPYSMHYSDLYKGRYDYQPGLVYWPGIFLWELPSYFIFKDIRVGFILAEFLILLGFWRLMKKLSIEKSLRLPIYLLWSFFPVQNFVLEQSWIDPGLMALTVWFFALLLEEKIILSAVLLGLMVSTKQYAVINALLLIPFLFVKLKAKKFFSFVLISLTTCLAVILPFFLANPKKFIEMTITVPSLQAFRKDSFSLIAIFWNNFKEINFLPLTWIMPLFFLITAFFFACIKRDLKNSTLILFFCYLGVFLFGKQAFCNYYFYLMPFLFIYFIFELSHLESQTLFEE